jgi:hypothetical protein
MKKILGPVVGAYPNLIEYISTPAEEEVVRAECAVRGDFQFDSLYLHVFVLHDIDGPVAAAQVCGL